jgi:tetratricopeptide (TPR) repeat protein
MTGATRQQLNYWARLGLVRPQARWGERFFDFSDLVAVETLRRLASRKFPAKRLCRAIDTLQKQLGQARAPLSSLRVSLEGANLVVHEPGPEGRRIEPLTGQFVLDFETAPLDRKVRSLGERTAEEWFELGMALDASDDTLLEAIEAYRQAINAAPEWVEAHINLGTTLYQLGRLHQSLESFRAAAKLDPENSLARFNLGCICDRLGDAENAVKEFSTAVALTPSMAEGHLNLALAYEKIGRKNDALDHLSLYLRYEPNGAWADFARARLATKRRVKAVPGKVTPFRRG